MNNKKQLIIVLDESTSKKGQEEIGPSLCFWAAYVYNPLEDNHPTNKRLPKGQRYEAAVLMKSLNLKPVRSGAIYNDLDTPIKISLDGIVRALEACLYLVYKHSLSEIIVVGDCETAINLACGKWNPQATAIISLSEKIENLVKEYKKKNARVEFKHVTEENFALYQDIDSLAKQIRGFMTKISK